MKLQQSSSLKPLVGQPRAFAVVTTGTSEYQIIHIISRNISTLCLLQRVGMIYLITGSHTWTFNRHLHIDILPVDLLKLREAARSVIASISLTFKLFGYLSRSVNTWDRLLTRKTIQGMGTTLKSTVFRLISLPSMQTYLFSMLLTILSAIFPLMLSMSSMIISGILIGDMFSRSPVRLPYFLPAKACPIILAFLIGTIFAYTIEMVSRMTMKTEIIKSSFQLSFTVRASLRRFFGNGNSLHVFAMFLPILLTALLTLFTQQVLGYISRGSTKELFRSGKNFLAFSASLISFRQNFFRGWGCLWFTFTGYSISTCFTLWIQVIWAVSCTMKKLSCSRIDILATSTSFVSLWGRFRERGFPSTSARLTGLFQSVCSISFVEMLKGSKFPFLALCTLLERSIIGWYNRIHSFMNLQNRFMDLGIAGVDSTCNSAYFTSSIYYETASKASPGGVS